MKQFTSKSQKIGEIGENITCRFLMKQGFEIVERNYTKKWGEIDIIVKKGNKIHFVEVKSVSRLPPACAGMAQASESLNNVSCETGDYRPEDNMHPQKLKRLSRTVETYLLEKDVSPETEWQFDLATVYIDLNSKKAKVNMVEDIVI